MMFFCVLLVFAGLTPGCLPMNAYHGHGHHHHRGVSHVGNGADFAFPEDHVHNHQQDHRHDGTGYKPAYSSTYMNQSMVPIPFLQKISNYTVSDLLLNYVDDYEDDPILANRFGEDVERSPAITPKPASCIPELTTVKLIETSDPSIIYIPRCTRIERCGGCCSHNLLSCQPVETETVSYKIVKTQFSAGNRLKYVGKEIIHMEKHTKCTCGCKIKKEDCNTFQKYYPAECRCGCTNTDEENKCYKNNSTKLWDLETCSCQCRRINNCSTGFTFDGNNCKCAPIPVRRRFAETPGQREDDSVQEALPASAFYETSNIDV